jgi:V-type H+-transporting ATPase subunit F
MVMIKMLTHNHHSLIQVADNIRYLLDQYDQIVPAILEIPSKETPYDPNKDYILARVKQFFGDNK